jgi:hypothetical protein
MFDEMSMRRLTVLEALRTLVAMAGQAILHIMPWSSLLCGLCKMWKQLVGFCLICRSIRDETLVIFLMVVLDACHNVALVVIATVFDMSANNVKAL